MPPSKATDILGNRPEPLIYDASGSAAHLSAEADQPHRCRMLAWSLSGFQKAAVIGNATTGRAWHMASDEGPNLNGWDAAPPPLGFLTVGLATAFAEEIQQLASNRGMETGALQIAVDNYYSVTGSMRARTMFGGALPFSVAVGTEYDVDDLDLFQLVRDGVHVSSVAGLFRDQTQGRFRVILNGAEIELSHPAPLGVVADPVDQCHAASAAAHGEALLASDGWSTKSTGAAPLHVLAAGETRTDGSLAQRQELKAPCGSAWRFIAGGAAAPDALSYVSEGIGFCFMTQLEILAAMHDVPVDALRLVQDTAFGPGGATGGTGKSPGFAPVETHLFVDAPRATAAQVSELVDLAERACYLHALCRTSVKPLVRSAGTKRKAS